jgi:hypothetical protein
VPLPEEVELYFAAGLSVLARAMPREEVRRALVEGCALGMSLRAGAFASGDASLVPLDVTDGPEECPRRGTTGLQGGSLLQR